MKLRNRGFGFVWGLFAFVLAHGIEVVTWTRWFGARHDPWFLNSGRAVAFTTGWLFVSSLIGGGLGLPGLAIAAGAAAGMVAALAWTGGSTIFPIVLTFGGLSIAFACLLGAWIGKELAGLIRGRSNS